MVAKNGFDVDDARLSAYALGELDEGERAGVEALLAGNADARQFVDELRATARTLERELTSEELPALTLAQRERIAGVAAKGARSTKRTPLRAWISYSIAASVTVTFIGGVLMTTRPWQSDRSMRRVARNPMAGASAPAAGELRELRGLGYLGAGDAARVGQQVPSAHYTAKTGAAAGIAVDDLNGVEGPGRDAFDTEAYDSLQENAFVHALDEALSTFSIDVDTASYANVRRFLNQGQLPPPGAVRVEEFINYFRYDYPQPTGGVPFSVTTDVATCPWKQGHLLVRIGLKGREVHVQERPASNLVFLIDVSGSMASPDKLGLVQQSLRMLAGQLDARDRVALVVYAGASGLVLDSTSGSERGAIVGAIEQLSAGGSTNGGAGIELAYKTAREHMVEGGTNRVILCTDGDFNVGTTSQDELVRLIERERKSGVFLSVLGFGTGNLKDATMEKLADKGNGNYGYVDSLNEARKLLVDELGGTLITIAKDVKIQVEFNPTEVRAWRLIGYENRVLAHQDFNDDQKDAGEIGAGHTVTALYEIVPVGVQCEGESVDPSRYQQPREPAVSAFAGELLFVKLRYKDPEGSTSKLLSTPVRAPHAEWSDAPADFRFAAAVAAFAMKLRGSAHVADLPMMWIYDTALASTGRDEAGYRSELVALVQLASTLGAR